MTSIGEVDVAQPSMEQLHKQISAVMKEIARKEEDLQKTDEKLPAAIAPNVTQRVCFRCNCKTTTLWRRNDKGETICNACFLFERNQNKKLPTTTKTNLTEHGEECTNCNATRTIMWRQNDKGETVCNACHLYYTMHNKERPIKVKAKSPKAELLFPICNTKDTTQSRSSESVDPLCRVGGLDNDQDDVPHPTAQVKQSEKSPKPRTVNWLAVSMVVLPLLLSEGMFSLMYSFSLDSSDKNFAHCREYSGRMMNLVYLIIGFLIAASPAGSLESFFTK